MIPFIDTETHHCRTPLVMAHNPPGPDMLVCGQPTVPGKTYCTSCRAVLYYRPTKTELKSLDWLPPKPK
jgi:hypothetical protein